MSDEIKKQIYKLLNESEDWDGEITASAIIPDKPYDSGELLYIMRTPDGNWISADYPHMYGTNPVEDPITVLSDAIEQMKGWLQSAEQLLKIAEEDDEPKAPPDGTNPFWNV